jgi:bifunctional non-homologous end joining protein LigD
MNYKPMLAIPMDKATITDWNEWALEQKFDGHRLLVEVTSVGVTAYTRPRKHAGRDGKTMATRDLPVHLTQALQHLPAGVYDGELMGGTTSTDVTRRDVRDSLSFAVFDVLRVGASDVTSESYDDRRERLEAIFEVVGDLPHVLLAQSMRLTCQADVSRLVQIIWDVGGEGAILKRRAARYQPGKRSPDFVKVKKLFTEVCVVVGFAPTKGKVMNRGSFAMVLLEDAKGRRTSVKTKDDAEREALQRAWDQRSSVTTHTDDPARVHPGGVQTPGCHPAIGRKLRIEYQDIAADGGYRHPRWDRWEDE